MLVLNRYADTHGTASLERLELAGRVCDVDAIATPPARTLRSLPARKVQ